METERYVIPMDTPTSNGDWRLLEGAEKRAEPCEDCPDPNEPGTVVLSLDQFKDWSETELLAAILAELIMLRTSIVDLANGLSEIGSVGFGSLFKGMFGGS